MKNKIISINGKPVLYSERHAAKESTTDKVRRIIDDAFSAFSEPVDDLTTKLILILCTLAVAVALFAIGFNYGYTLSNRHFVEQLNKNHMERNLPAVDELPQTARDRVTHL